jgi:energy-coupling factor transporter transmembrane protein EcfT
MVHIIYCVFYVYAHNYYYCNQVPKILKLTYLIWIQIRSIPSLLQFVSRICDMWQKKSNDLDIIC